MTLRSVFVKMYLRLKRGWIMENLYKSILNGLYDGVYFVDRKRKITFWNKAAEELTGYSAEELEGRFCFDNILDHKDMKGKNLCFSGCPLFETIKDGSQREAAVFLRHKSGERKPVVVKTMPLYEGDEIIGAIEIFNDNYDLFTTLVKMNQYKDMAYTDKLTGLPNRHFIDEFLNNKDLRSGVNTYVLFMDIDNFKHVNDTYGHDFGDTVLASVGKMTRRFLKKSDEVFRYGGEEFVALIFDDSSENVISIAERIRKKVEELVFEFEGKEVQVTISGGVAMQSSDEKLDEAIKRADQFMYKAKMEGKNRIKQEL